MTVLQNTTLVPVLTLITMSNSVSTTGMVAGTAIPYTAIGFEVNNSKYWITYSSSTDHIYINYPGYYHITAFAAPIFNTANTNQVFTWGIWDDTQYCGITGALYGTGVSGHGEYTCVFYASAIVYVSGTNSQKYQIRLTRTPVNSLSISSGSTYVVVERWANL